MQAIIHSTHSDKVEYTSHLILNKIESIHWVHYMLFCLIKQIRLFAFNKSEECPAHFLFETSAANASGTNMNSPHAQV